MILEHNPKDKFTAILWESVTEPTALTANLDKWKNQANRAEALTHTQSKANGRDDWLGAPNVTELQNRLERGWADGVKRIEQIATRELSAPASVRRRRVRGDAGDELDMQAVWRGDLNRAWSRTRRANRVGSRTVSSVIDLAAHAGVWLLCRSVRCGWGESCRFKWQAEHGSVGGNQVRGFSSGHGQARRADSNGWVL